MYPPVQNDLMWEESSTWEIWRQDSSFQGLCGRIVTARRQELACRQEEP